MRNSKQKKSEKFLRAKFVCIKHEALWVKSFELLLLSPEHLAQDKNHTTHVTLALRLAGSQTECSPHFQRH